MIWIANGWVGSKQRVNHRRSLSSVVWMGGFTAIAVVGSFFGAAMSKRISAETLKRTFAGLVIVVATYIVIKQGLILWWQPRRRIG